MFKQKPQSLKNKINRIWWGKQLPIKVIKLVTCLPGVNFYSINPKKVFYTKL